MPLSTGRLLQVTRDYFVGVTNATLSSLALPWITPIQRLKRQGYVQESVASATLSQFRYDVAPIGKKYPRVGRLSSQHDCPLCPCATRNSVSHLALFCPSIEKIRKEQTSIASFRNICLFKGFSEDHTFHLLMNGLDWNENPVEPKDFLMIGKELKLLMDLWLARW